MCSGNNEHHRREEAKREAARQSAAYEEALRAAEQRNAQTIEAMKPKYTPLRLALVLQWRITKVYRKEITQVKHH